MNELEFRRLLGYDPKSSDEDFRRFIESNKSAADAYDNAMKFERNLEQAFNIDAPKDLVQNILLTQTTKICTAKQQKLRRSWMAIAASTLLAIGISAGVWQNKLYSNESMELMVLDHIYYEEKFLNNKQIKSDTEVAAAFARHGVELKGSFGDITYIRDCQMLENTGLHLIVENNFKPITVFYIPGENIAQRIDISDTRFTGYVENASGGSIAVIGDANDIRMMTLGQSIREAIRPLDQIAGL